MTSANNTYLNLLDVSHHNGVIDWNKVAHKNAQKIVGSYIKCTEGLTFFDNKFKFNWKHARENDLLTGAYHLMHFVNDDPIKQAQWFLKNCNISDKCLPPAVDLETSKLREGLDSGMLQEDICGAIKRFCITVYMNSGKNPIIYCSKRGMSLLQSLGGLQIYYLWICDYSQTSFDNNKPRIPYPWDRSNLWHLWQYTSSGRINGISGDLDLDYYNGTYEDLMRLYI